MKRIAITAVVFFLVSALSVAAQGIDQEKKTVGFLFGTIHPRNQNGVPVTDQAGKPLSIELALGTAFFVGYPDPRRGPTNSFIYLVTAKHVLEDADGTFLKEVKVRLNLKDASGGKQWDYLSLQVSDLNGNLLWFHDTDAATDVAIAPLLPDQKKFDFLAIPTVMFADDPLLKSEKVVEGDSLNFVGLMSQYYGDSKNYPVVRRGTLALMTDEEIDTPTGRQHAFIAELASWPGNSGSPVFLNLGGFREGAVIAGMNLHLLGILSGSFLNKVKGTTVDTASIMSGNDLNTGISFIIPAGQIKKILDSQPAQQYRDMQIEKLLAPK
ncbi:MAG: serine protease [Acidobacteriia bacterium]|nr:serine protease [Terriglobia bacterium]